MTEQRLSSDREVDRFTGASSRVHGSSLVPSDGGIVGLPPRAHHTRRPAAWNRRTASRFGHE